MTSRTSTTLKTQSDGSKPWHPHAYQKRGIKWLLEHAGAGLFFDPGLGKTSVTLAAIKILKQEKLLRRALVVAPKRVMYEVWPVEAKDWTDFHDLRVVVLHGPKKEQALQQDADIYIINPDGLSWLLDSCDEVHTKFLKSVDTLVIDESSKFKHSNTKRFKLIRNFLPMFKRRWILTGSPNPNGYLDLFGQIFIIDLGKSLGRYVTHYRTNFFNPTGFGGYTWVLKPESDKAIQARIKPYILRLEAEDYLDMPEEIQNVIRVDLPPAARKVYDDLEDELFATLDNGANITALSAGAASIKCEQVANGGLYYSETKCTKKCEGFRVGSCTCLFEQRVKVAPERKYSELHEAKIEALVDLIDELQGSPLLVAYGFKHDLTRIQNAIGKDTPNIGGGTSVKETSRIIEQWNAGKIPVLLAHPAAMGHGLNLQKGPCKHVCHFNITWDYEQFDQFNRRVRRQGSKHAEIFVHFIAVRDTVDEAKLRALSYKKRTQNSLLDALKAYRRSR